MKRLRGYMKIGRANLEGFRACESGQSTVRSSDRKQAERYGLWPYHLA